MTPYRPLIFKIKHFGALGPSPIDFSFNFSVGTTIHIKILEIQKFDL